MLEPTASQHISTQVSRQSTAARADHLQPESAENISRVSRQPQEPASSSTKPSSAKRDSVQLSEEAREIAKLALRDREVRAHEAAHAATGGQFAGAPSLSYKKGPDGRSYATGGEVSIDTSVVSGDPQATLQKAQIIRAAALAPNQPSAQDMRIAAKASVMASRARADLARQANEELNNILSLDKKMTGSATVEVAPVTDRIQPNYENSDSSAFIRTIA